MVTIRTVSSTNAPIACVGSVTASNDVFIRIPRSSHRAWMGQGVAPIVRLVAEHFIEGRRLKLMIANQGQKLVEQCEYRSSSTVSTMRRSVPGPGEINLVGPGRGGGTGGNAGPAVPAERAAGGRLSVVG
jgi:hypothetical protein